MMEFQAMKHVRVLLAAAAVLVPVQLNAAGSTGELSFTANVLSECAIDVQGSGTLLYVNSTQLSTEVTGGVRALAEITTNDGGFFYSAPPPTAWDAPVGGTYEFKTLTTLTDSGGELVADQQNLSAHSLGIGVTNASIGLEVDRTDGVFSPATYNVKFNITCS